MGVLAGSAVLGQGPVCTLLAGVVAGFAVSSTSPESLDGGIIAVVVIDAGESVGEDLEPLIIGAVAASGGDEERRAALRMYPYCCCSWCLHCCLLPG